MDALDQLAPEAAALLARVDATLARCGADVDHPVWPLLRRVRALPGEVVSALAEVRPGPLAAAGSPLRSLAEGYGEEHVPDLPADVWRGAGAESFARRWSAMSAHLDGGPDTLTDRLVDTAGYLDAVAGWLAQARDSLARALAEVLTSAEAVRVRTARMSDDWSAVVPPEVGRACADIAAHVLRQIAEAHERGRTMLDEWPPRLAELAFYATASGSAPGLTAETEVRP